MIEENKIFIVGSNGQLGTALREKYPDAQFADIDELDITDKNSVNNFDWSGVSIILNAAAYTNVDGAESADGRRTSWLVNATAIGYLVDITRKNNITLVHVSSDYVFDGTNKLHNEDESFAPLNSYGASKAAGDLLVGFLEKHYILRTSWVIGEGKNFVRTMIDLGKKGVSPGVVSDQIGRLTFTSELVRAIDYLLKNSVDYGTYNVTNSGDSVSWAEISRQIFICAGIDLKVTDVTTRNYYKDKVNIAPRPLQSTLDLSKIESTGFKPTDWRIDLKQYIAKELK